MSILDGPTLQTHTTGPLPLPQGQDLLRGTKRMHPHCVLPRNTSSPSSMPTGMASQTSGRSGTRTSGDEAPGENGHAVALPPHHPAAPVTVRCRGASCTASRVNTTVEARLLANGQSLQVQGPDTEQEPRDLSRAQDRACIWDSL